MSASLEIRVLGPVEVRTVERVVPLHRLQVRQVLGLLAARPGQTLGTDDLVDQLWSSAMPAHPRRALQVAISRLRSALGDSANVVRASGSTYTLHADQTDLIWFESGLEAARTATDPATAITSLDEALGLWRGSPFSDATGPPLLDQVRGELHEARLVGVTLLAEALIAHGDTERAVIATRRWFESEPHRERLAACLAQALAAEGRKTEALSVLNKLRDALRNQMGINPSAFVEQLEQGILSGSVDLFHVPAVIETPTTDTVFVGREHHVAKLTKAAGERACVIVVGEAGMGKSALLDRIVTTLRHQGRRVISIRVDPEPARPLAPVADVVTALVEQYGAEPDNELGMAAVGRLSADRQTDGDLRSHVNREDLIMELSRFVTNSAGSADVRLVIDDFHLVDPVSAAIFEEVIGSGKCTVLAGARPSSETHLERLLHGKTPAQVLELEPLTPAAVFKYMDIRYRGRNDIAKLTELRHQSGGNPLFLSLLVDLDLEGALQPGSLPTSIMVAVRSRLDSLASRAIETLQLAAALGTRFSLVTLRQLRASADLDIGDAEEARLVVRDGADDAEFVHGLVADATYQLLSAGHRIEAHDSLGQILERCGAPPTEYVSHYTAAASLDPFRGATANLQAGITFADAYSLEIALANFTSGLNILDKYGGADTDLAVELMIRLGRTQRLVADPAHVTTLVRCAILARAHDDSDAYARAVIELCSHGGTTKAGQSDAETLGLIDDVLSRELSIHTRAELLASASALTALSNQYRRGQRFFHEALRIADAISDPVLDAHVLVHAHLGLSHPEDFHLREAAAERLEEVAGADVDLHWEVSLLRFWQAFVEADPERMETSIIAMRDLTPRARHRHLSLAHIETAYAHVLGDLDAAEELLNEALEMALTMFPKSWAIAHYSGLIYAIRSSQGRLPELREQVDGFVEQLPEFPNWRVGQAVIAVEMDDADLARRILGDLEPDGFEILSRDLTWTVALAQLARVAAHLEDRAAASVLYQLLVAHQRQMSWAGTCTMGPNDEALALLARTLGDDERARQHAGAADEITRRLIGRVNRGPASRGHDRPR